MNFFELIRTANHNLLRNKIRTALTILAIFVGSFTIILNSAIHTGVNSFIDEQIESLGGEDALIIIPESSLSTTSSMMGMSQEVQEFNPSETLSTFSDESIEEIKNIDGIFSDSIYLPRVLTTAYITSSHTDKKFTFDRVEGIPPGNFHVSMSAGNLPDYRSTEDEIAIEYRYLEPLGFKDAESAIGQIVTIGVKNPLAQNQDASFITEDTIFEENFSEEIAVATEEYLEFEAKIVGVEASGMLSSSESVVSRPLEDQLYDAATSYLPEEMRDLTYYIQARFDTTKFTEAEIKSKLKEKGYIGLTISDMMGAIRSFFDAIMAIFTIFGGIALLVAAIGIINTLLMAVEERTREIGLDKALGMSSGRVFLSFSMEAIMLGFWGSFIGVLVAMLTGVIANSAVHAPGAFLEVFPTFELFKFTPGNILPIVVTVMIIAFVAGTAPAWKAAHKDPIEALRYE